MYQFILITCGFSEKRQTMLFSATIDEKVKNLIKLALTTDPVWISVKDDNQSTVTGLQQGYVLYSHTTMY